MAKVKNRVLEDRANDRANDRARQGEAGRAEHRGDARGDARAKASWYGIGVGTRWRDAAGSSTVVVLWVKQSGVVIYRREEAAPDDERVTNVVRFVETFAPEDAASGAPGLALRQAPDGA